MIYDITLTVVDSSTSTTHAGAAVSIEVVQVVGQVNTGDGGAVTSVAGRTGDVTLTKTDVGLANVDNTADAAKPVSTAQATADAAAQAAAEATAANALAAHVSAADPHTGYQKESEKGVANGYASLDGDGKVPSAQLPSVGGGKIINVWTASTTTAVAGTTAIPLDDTIPQITEGMELIRVSVTPTNPSSNLMVTVRFWYTCSGAHYASCALFVGAGPNASASSFLSQNASSIPALATVVFIIPSFSGTQDISFRAGTDRASVTFRMLSVGGGTYYSTTDPAIMIVEEIAP